MPIHRMQCQKCDHQWEHFAVNSREIPQCPKCDETIKIAQLYPNQGSFQLKGEGWFKDGY